MLNMYEHSKLAKSSARMAFSATAEPMLMSDRSTQTTSEIMIALIGMFQTG